MMERVRAGEQIAVIDRDLARRVAAVEALCEHGFRAYGVAGTERLLEDKRTPDMVVLRVADRAELEDAILSLREQERIAGTPLLVVASFESDVQAVDAFALGAADYVDEDVEIGELCARLEARLDRHRSVASLSRKHRSTEILLELTQALSSTLELRDIMFLVVKRIAEVVDVERASIVLGGGDEVAYVIAASDDEKLRDLPIDLGKYPEIKRVLETGRPFVVEDASNHPLFDIAQVAVPSRFHALTLYPILFEDKPMGVLFLRFGHEQGLSDEMDFVLRAVANATGIALRNASLLHTMKMQTSKSRNAHVEAEKQLRALQRYVDFFDSCADGIMVVTLGGEVLFCNPAACVITGRSEQELRSGTFERTLTPDGRQRFVQLRDAFADGIFPNNVDLPIRTGDGRRRVLNVSFSSVLHEHNGVIVSLRDVTDERALARELTKTKEFLQRVIDSSVDAIVSADMHGTVLLFNPAAERTYGYKADDVVGKVNVRDLYPSGVAEEIMEHIRSGDDGRPGELREYETQLVIDGGGRVPVMLSASLITHRGRPIGSVGIFKDLRAKVAYEERLESAQKQLADKEQKAFIAELAGATAHELNQPLTTVMGYAGMISKELDEASRLGRAASAIVRETERMAEIVRKIGKLTKYESKAYVGDTKIIDIEKSIDSEPPVTGY